MKKRKKRNRSKKIDTYDILNTYQIGDTILPEFYKKIKRLKHYFIELDRNIGNETIQLSRNENIDTDIPLHYTIGYIDDKYIYLGIMPKLYR